MFFWKGGVIPMKDFRCTCKKLIFQIEGNTVIIKCRHCKRYIHIHTKGLIEAEFKLETELEEVIL